MSFQKQFVLRNEINAKALYAFLKQNWRAMANKGHPLAVTVSEYKSKRSVEQNKRYWLILNQIAESAWVNGRQFSADAWHEHYKRLFIGVEELPSGKEAGISTTTLDIEEFGNYMTRIEANAAQELGVELEVL